MIWHDVRDKLANIDWKTAQTRFGVRRPLIVGAAVLTLFFLVFGGLSWRTATIGLIGMSLWLVATATVFVTREEPRPFYIGPEPLRDAMASTALAPGGGDPATPPKEPTWRKMLEGIPDAVLALDIDARVLATNAAANAIFAVQPGRHISQIVRVPELLSAVDVARESGAPQTCAMRLSVPVERVAKVRITPFEGAGGEDDPALLVVIRDMTEPERVMRLRADFVANASHELRTPLAALKGAVETLQGSAKDDPAGRARFLDLMNNQVTRMSRLVNDLLSLSRVEMHEHIAPREPIDLAEVASSVVRDSAALAEAGAVTLTFTPPAASAIVSGDRDELAQLTQNLVQNAIKYGRRGGRVEVEIGREGDRVTLSIADDGIGIAPEHLPRLTERFYRVNAKESRDRGGTGLGLAIVKHIVNRHRGELKFASVVGKGSTFTVRLPTHAKL